MKLQKLLIALFAIATIFTACKKTETVNPTTIIQEPAEKEGEIKGILSGIFADNTPFSYKFILNGVGSALQTSNQLKNTYSVNSDTSTTISISKYYAGDGDSLVFGQLEFQFTVRSLGSLASPVSHYLHINIVKKIGTDKTQVYQEAFGDLVGSSNAHPMTFSNLKYDNTTKILSGDFTASLGLSNYYEYMSGERKITNGSFSTKITQLVR